MNAEFRPCTLVLNPYSTSVCWTLLFAKRAWLRTPLARFSPNTVAIFRWIPSPPGQLCLRHLWVSASAHAFPHTRLAFSPSLSVSGSFVFSPFLAASWSLKSRPLMQSGLRLAFGTLSCCMLRHLLFFVLCMSSPIPGWHLAPLFQPLEALLFDPFWRHCGPSNHVSLFCLDCALLSARFLVVCCVICCFLCSACFPPYQAGM